MQRLVAHPVPVIVAGALVSVALCLLIEGLGAHYLEAPAWQKRVRDAIWILAYAVPLCLILYALLHSFRRHERRELLATIVCSYFSLILVFAGVYYSIAVAGDLEDAQDKYAYYRAVGANLPPDGATRVWRLADQRAFRGIDSRLWSGVDWVPSRFVGVVTLPVEDLIAAARRPIEDVIEFQPDARPTVLGDCLYFSVVTMTTLGFGDITPQLWYAKMAVASQSLSSMVLFVLALGMVFGGWWSSGAADDV